MKQAMVTNARKVVVMCDSSKLGNDYLVSFGSTDDIDVLITDNDAPASFVEEIERNGVQVILTEEEE